MSKHTPGPWEYDGKFTVGIPADEGTFYFRTRAEDARLISAAPEMLEKLKYLAKELLNDSYYCAAVPDIELIISKAGGRE